MWGPGSRGFDRAVDDEQEKPLADQQAQELGMLDVTGMLLHSLKWVINCSRLLILSTIFSLRGSFASK
jgi:hypothetical protein